MRCTGYQVFIASRNFQRARIVEKGASSTRRDRDGGRVLEILCNLSDHPKNRPGPYAPGRFSVDLTSGTNPNIFSCPLLKPCRKDRHRSLRATTDFPVPGPPLTMKAFLRLSMASSKPFGGNSQHEIMPSGTVHREQRNNVSPSLTLCAESCRLLPLQGKQAANSLYPRHVERVLGRSTGLRRSAVRGALVAWRAERQGIRPYKSRQSG